MIKILYFWNRKWQSIGFNAIRGVGRVFWLRRKPKRCQGWAAYQNGCWYALYAEPSSLIFQAGPNKWSMSDDSLHCRNALSGDGRIFTLSRGEEIVWKLGYKNSNKLALPFLDDLELETIDFFYWVSTVWNDKKLGSDLLNSWTKL